MKDISSSGLSAQEQEAYKADFARRMNLIPEDKARWIPEATSFLWDETKKTLDNSTFASTVLTEQENSLLNEAIDFLTDETHVNGFKIAVPSIQVTKYKYYAEIYNKAFEIYINEKLTVQYSTGTEGEKLREQWLSYRKRQLEEAIKSAEQDWLNLGYRLKVQDYQSVIFNLEPKRYPNLYREAYLTELMFSKVGGQVPYYATFFSPRDAFENDLPWSKLDLTGGEIDSLVELAPDDLKNLFNENIDSKEISVSSMSAAP